MGIGLTIVKDFVEVMNGKIDLESEIGVGTKVRITLPPGNEFSVRAQDEIFVREFVIKRPSRKSVKLPEFRRVWPAGYRLCWSWMKTSTCMNISVHPLPAGIAYYGLPVEMMH